MALRGSLEEASVSDVLQLLSMGRKTGRLSVTDWTNLGYIYLDSGRITFVTLANRRDRLGDILLKSGKISEEHLARALRLREVDPGKKLGEALADIGAIDRAELEDHMRVQIEECAYFLFTWRRGNFTFESGLQPEGQDILVSIEPGSLMLEGARRSDEWTLVEQKIPSFDLVFKIDTDQLTSYGESLSGAQKKLVPLLDGTRSVAMVVDESGMVEFEVGKAIYELVDSGLANAVGRLRSAPKPLDQDEGGARGSEMEEEAQHLDYVQLTTYLAHGGEFRDPERSKEAALHITHCTTCSERLRNIHRRRSGALPAPTRAATGEDPVGGHLDDLQMLNYVAREGEFSDLDRRREAGKHIADCSECSARLKAVRRRPLSD